MKGVATLLAPQRRTVAWSAALGLTYVALALAVPWLLGAATDLVVAGRIGVDLARTLLVAAASGAAAAVAAAGQGRLVRSAVACTVARLRAALHAKLGRVAIAHLDEHPRGELLSRVTGDVDNLAQGLHRVLDHLAWAALTMVGALAVMVWISPLLTAAVLTSVPLSLWVTTRLAQRARPGFAQQWAATGRLTAHVEQAYTAHALVRTLAREDAMVDAFDGINRELAKAAERAWTVSGTIAPVMTFVDNLAYVLIATVGAVRVTQGAISIGDVVAFIAYARQFSQPVIELSGVSGLLQSAAASARRVFALLDAPEEVAPAVAPDLAGALPTSANVTGRLAFEHVGFSYPGGTPVIANLSLEVPAGSTVAIVGASGAGKTTLVSLLLRFHDPAYGRITLDGRDIATMAHDDVRRMIAVVDQTGWLFHGTLGENIAYGDPGAGSAAVRRAAVAACADRFIAALPDGYDTVVGDDATNLSTGEKQLVTIARALLANRPLLVLDEATSAVDADTEELVRRGLAQLRAGRTSLVIAHRLDTVRDADLVAVLEGGRIVESGRYDELCRAGGAFAALHAARLTA